MKQHFESEWYETTKRHVIKPKTSDGGETVGARYCIYAPNDEISQGCINRIVDNLNKLAEHNAKLDAANKNGAS